MNIVIYDEDDSWRERSKEIIGKYMKQVTNEIGIYCCRTRETLMEAEVLGEDREILFLDLDSENENGIEMAKAVNKKWPECQIIFYSENLKYATEVYHAVHTYFVLKEQLEDRIAEIFVRIFEKKNQRKKRILFSVIGGKKISLLTEEILYFERTKRVTRIVSVLGNYETRDKLDSIAEKLPEKDFLRCHNSYIVNRLAICEKQKNYFVMRNGDNVAISRSYVKAIREL